MPPLTKISGVTKNEKKNLIKREKRGFIWESVVNFYRLHLISCRRGESLLIGLIDERQIEEDLERYGSGPIEISAVV